MLIETLATPHTESSMVDGSTANAGAWPMKIWLINPYGPVPSEAWRLYCFSLIGRALAEKGHEVVWWTSSFSHHFKKQRCEGWQDVAVAAGFKIRLVPTPGYTSNISLGRIWRDIVFAARTFKRGRQEPRPDCIVFAESPLTFGYAGDQLAQHHHCPVVNHQMDLWPELIVKAFPKALQASVELLFWPVYRARQKTYRRLSASTALARPYLEAVMAEAPRLRDQPNAVVYNGIDVAEFRSRMGLKFDSPVKLPDKLDGDIWAVFAGSLGPSYDIQTLCQVADLLSRTGERIYILIAGDGPMRTMLEERADDAASSRLIYLGQLPPVQLAALYSRCDVGLCAYSARSNVEMPDKIYDYTAAGLVVLNSLQGEVREVVENHGIGYQYQAGQAADLLSGLRALAADPVNRTQMAQRSMALGSTFDQGIQVAKLVQVIEQVCTRPR